MLQPDSLISIPDTIRTLTPTSIWQDSITFVVNGSGTPEWYLFISVVAILLAAWVPMFFETIRSHAQYVGEVGSALLILRGVGHRLKKHIPDVKQFAKAIKDDPEEVPFLPLDTTLSYEWANTIPWKSVIEAARGVWSKSTDAVEFIVRLWRAAIGINTASAKIQEMYQIYIEDLNRFKADYTDNANKIESIMRSYRDSRGGTVADSDDFYREAMEIRMDPPPCQNDAGNGKPSVMGHHEHFISRLDKLCRKHNTHSLAKDIQYPIRKCNEAHVNIRVLANVYSSSYEQIGEYLSDCSKELSLCAQGLAEERFKKLWFVPWFTIYVASRGRTLNWKRGIQNRFTDISPPKENETH